MRAKYACLIINPRTGENLAKLGSILGVLTAAGWDTDVLIKEYGGQTLELARDAGQKKYDLIIAYGGDGTLSQVVNGILSAKNKRVSVGLLPGGTANVWATEVGIPTDPVKSALTLINSQARRVDVGHVEVVGLNFPPTAGESPSDTSGMHDAFNQAMPVSKKRKSNSTSKAHHDFLLMAGLGIDAAIMGHVSKPLKYRIGPLAVGMSAAKELPKQRVFPVEISALSSKGEQEHLWKGEALQVVISNTRRYADVVEMAPDAYIDDGSLDVCVITAHDAITTMQQIMSLLLRRKPDNLDAEFFHGARLLISVPASIALQVDGSAVKLKDYLSKQDRAALREAIDPGQVIVTYRFDAMPRSLSVAIPCSYNNALFESAQHQADNHHQAEQGADQQAGEDQATSQAQEGQAPSNQAEEQEDQEQKKPDEQSEPLAIPEPLKKGRAIKVIGASHNPDKRRPLYVIAGNATKQSTGEIVPVAVRVDSKTTVLRRSGGVAPLAEIEALQEGAEIAVEGKKRKRGVIAATQVVI